jgi:DNA-binding response OmpR family regulator
MGLADEQPQAGGDGGLAGPSSEVLCAGPLEVRPAERVALADGRLLTLTVRELQLLTALARRPDRVVSRSELHASVWDGPFRAHDRSVDVYVSKVRGKLEEASPGWRYIHTHFGFGYRFSPSPLHDFHRSLTPR